MSTYQQWHIPYHEDSLSLGAALCSIPKDAPSSEQALPMLQWLNGLKTHKQETNAAEIQLTKQQHDCILITLGRGLLKTDEIFATGFTLASICKGTMTEQSINAFISKNLTRVMALLTEQEIAVFKDAVKLAFISGCIALNRFQYDEWLEQPLRVLRDALGLEHELITSYYAVEQRRYPHNPASHRLVPESKQVAAF